MATLRESVSVDTLDGGAENDRVPDPVRDAVPHADTDGDGVVLRLDETDPEGDAETEALNK
jgi:hypothetical protein